MNFGDDRLFLDIDGNLLRKSSIDTITPIIQDKHTPEYGQEMDVYSFNIVQTNGESFSLLFNTYKDANETRFAIVKSLTTLLAEFNA